MSLFSMRKNELEEEKRRLLDEYNKFKEKNLKLDMSRGKPSKEQVELSSSMLDIINSKSVCETREGVDCRNYGLLDGIMEIRELFAEIMQVSPEQVFVGGNSSLNMMFDTISCYMTHGVCENEPWIKQGDVKFLCPVPGYDRHFSILEYFGIGMITVPMTDNGPDMDIVEKLVSTDDTIKGIWCVPKYSNPEGITYSDDTVRRFAKLRPAASDFRIFWDNAYAIHGITDKPDILLNLMDECVKEGNEDLPIIFCSTSKVTFPGSGVAAMAASLENMKEIRRRYSFQTIGFDKINQLRHIYFFKNYSGVLRHMQKHKNILKPKFDIVINYLNNELADYGVAKWKVPNGGYFISVDVTDGCANRVVELCKDAGVILTPAGATYPYKNDPYDRNIRIAPTYPPESELKSAMELFCICVKLASIEKQLNKN